MIDFQACAIHLNAGNCPPSNLGGCGNAISEHATTEDGLREVAIHCKLTQGEVYRMFGGPRSTVQNMPKNA